MSAEKIAETSDGCDVTIEQDRDGYWYVCVYGRRSGRNPCGYGSGSWDKSTAIANAKVLGSR